MIVMKFGGTSVEDAKAIDRVAAIVQGRQSQQPVVVVSAMAKVTDTLLTMAKAAGNGERKTALKLCRSLQERHRARQGFYAQKQADRDSGEIQTHPSIVNS